jgi:hypothetical protein
LLYVGVTVIVDVIGAVVLFSGVKTGSSDPFPELPKPIDGLLLTQLKLVVPGPVFNVTNGIALVATPAHSTWGLIAAI